MYEHDPFTEAFPSCARCARRFCTKGMSSASTALTSLRTGGSSSRSTAWSDSLVCTGRRSLAYMRLLKIPVDLILNFYSEVLRKQVVGLTI